MRSHFVSSVAVVAIAATLFAVQLRSSLAQDAPAPPKAAPLSEAAVRGKAIFAEKCALCHNAETTEKKIGPGLKGFYQRGTFTSDNSKVTDEAVTKLIENGKGMMPPFKGSLESAKIQDLVAYLKTL
ncbi:cytochrome c [Granulicella sp. dw_53]|uniref:c-type cytochrome n=1 Tax=Granulicella sp. dw_53 TaxID=2719792 RepID=UPI001BD3AA7E|nr:cytochrome c [Granulicella sp. dw_53]